MLTPLEILNLCGVRSIIQVASKPYCQCAGEGCIIHGADGSLSAVAKP